MSSPPLPEEGGNTNPVPTPPAPLFPAGPDGGSAPPPGLVPLSPAGGSAQLPESSPGKLMALVICDNCEALGHMKRNCPRTECNSCGRLGHYKQDCPQEAAKRQRAVDTDDGLQDEEEYRWSVCRGCGSSRHIQANCPVRYQALECYQCHQRGHIMTSCPQTRCYNCGTFGHSSQVCHSKPHCFHCSHTGHRSSECPMRHKGRVCYQCNKPGHEAANCPQGQLCRMCRRPGHLVAQCPEVTCNACHQRGHTAGGCFAALCSNCGGSHGTLHCTLPNTTALNASRRSRSPSCGTAVEDSEAATAINPQFVHARGTDVGDASTDSASTTAVASALSHEDSSPLAVPPYKPLVALRSGRVAVVIDGPYFERCVRPAGGLPRTADSFVRTADALRAALQLIGDVCHKEPIGYWFDTNPASFTEFLEKAVPLHHREQSFRESALRKRFLTDEMNGGRSLHNVVSRLVGGMKKQKGYTKDGPGFVWVQTGVDVAMATCVVELFQDRRQFQQVVLLCGDSDVYPAVHYCNTQRRVSPNHSDSSPVRVCGTSSSISKLYGQHQDLSDFLPSILLDNPTHIESGTTIEFPSSIVFF